MLVWNKNVHKNCPPKILTNNECMMSHAEMFLFIFCNTLNSNSNIFHRRLVIIRTYHSCLYQQWSRSEVCFLKLFYTKQPFNIFHTSHSYYGIYCVVFMSYWHNLSYCSQFIPSLIHDDFIREGGAAIGWNIVPYHLTESFVLFINNKQQC